MSIVPPRRTRQQRVAAVELPPGMWKTLWTNLQRGAVLLRLAMCAAAAIFLWAFTKAWDPPFNHRLGEVPHRNVIARVDFDQPDPAATNKARDEARRFAIGEYDQNPEPLVQLRGQLVSDIGKVLQAKTLAEVDPALWKQFQPPLAAGTPDPTPEEQAAQFERFREAFAAEGAMDAFSDKLADVMAPYEQRGLLKELPPDAQANTERILVRSKGTSAFGAEVNVSEVRIKQAAAKLQQSLKEELPSVEVAERAFAWLEPKLPETLTLNKAATVLNQDKAAADQPEITKPFAKGKDLLAEANKPLNEDSLKLLRLEHEAALEQRTASARLHRSVATLGMFVGLYTLAGFYLYRRDRRVVDELLRLVALLGLFVACVALAKVVSQYAWGADVIPLLLFAMIIAIAYQQEMALLLSICATLVVVVSIGHGFTEALSLAATVAGAVLVLRQVRTRSRLLMVGFAAAAVGFFTTVGVGILDERSWTTLLTDGFKVALWSVIAGSLMTVMLPTVEKMFGVETDLSLIELGDPAHPLLQELIRRAPGTYNHSITVASLAEAAAESIGARGLLVRVGAYFHDIGKMLKPQYFIENQTKGDNRHDSLVPAMSTLVIIAHVKDGADLARQNRLPESIIDFIQQHHGTTLVEYFYRQANQKKVQEDPDGGALDESAFRYPGPKPQTREAGVLMLADAVESASRVLKEPTASRIENLVHEISMKRLLDGQFDESGLTLEDIRKIGESLVKSLTAVYHGRVKYPDQETA
ncbi:HD family phosphohydrolase [Lacipirellula parvula]|uniref:Membrane protein containing HD superfamily hydrolase domain protein n=1 Tax=Lacipirellula parvula TaxID=2650471 RepID=A0A5K7XBK9_9BACT|nr:HDIG domain-containing metalloprotein [Lacipirellula parvula]BBO31736.1 membrane protein containing HD superfamily hydrolase domain protein [Lacipirellula parvula]